MTLKKPGHNRSRGDSAWASIHEGTPKSQNGPEACSEDAPSRNGEDDQNKSLQDGYTRGTSGADRGTTPESSRVKAVAPARFGSPFAYKIYQNKEDFFIGLLDEGTRVLFDHVVAEATTLRERLSTGLRLTDDRDNPRVCCLKRRESSSKNTDIREERGTNESELNILTFPTDSDILELDDVRGISVHRDRVSKPGETQYFVMNTGENSFLVNETYVKSSVKYGALPDFAVFQTGKYSYFWWCTAAALDYNPIIKRIRRSEHDDAQSPKKALRGNTDRSNSSSTKSSSLGKRRAEDGDEQSPRKALRRNTDRSSSTSAKSSSSGKRLSEDSDGKSPRRALRSNTDGSNSTSAESPSPGEPASPSPGRPESPSSSRSESPSPDKSASPSSSRSESPSPDKSASPSPGKPESQSPGETEPPPNPQVFLDSKKWIDEYRRRLQICEERPIKYSSSVTAMHPPHEGSSGDMQSIDVVLAIGAVWLGLMEAKIDFAYANSDLFSLGHSMRRVGMHAVKGTNHFPMPLLFNEESLALSPEPEKDIAEPIKPVFSAFQQGERQRHQEHLATTERARKRGPGNKANSPISLENQKVQNKDDKGGIGHFVLAIAEKVVTDSPIKIKDALAGRALVRLRIMDSADGVVDRGLIRRVARNTIRHAGWHGDIWPWFDESEESWVNVLGQGQSGNRSGEHTVLNAWAYMLNIPLATTRDRSFGRPSYDEVRRLITLALQGQLDSLTIRAWMQHSKYAADKSLSELKENQAQQPDLPNNLRNMQTVALNRNSFNQTVNEIYMQEQAGKQTHTIEWGDIPVKTLLRVNLPTFGRNPIPTQDPTSRQDPASASSQDSDPSSISIYYYIDPPGPPDSSSQSWCQSLVHHLNLNEDKSTKTPRRKEDRRKNATVIHRESSLADYEVVLAIASIWEGLKRLYRPHFDFAYAGMDVFSPGGDLEKIGAVGGWHRFIMPLFISSVGSKELDKQGHGRTINKVGHLLLCVAELVDVDETRERPAMTVRLEILDSSPGTVSQEDILREAKSKIEKSRWLGRKGVQRDVEYNLTFREVPRQVGINTCGLYTILNAWAYMLGIPIHEGRFRRGRDEKTLNDNVDLDFLRQGLEIVNLALEGFMDSATIQAFFHNYGYSVEQRFGDSARAVVKVYAIGMNLEKLERTLRRWRMVEKTESAKIQKKEFNEEDTHTLMNENGLTRDEAWTALVMGKGHVDRAISWHFKWDVFGQLPLPEEALSPQTPAMRRIYGQRPPPEDVWPPRVPYPRDRY